MGGNFLSTIDMRVINGIALFICGGIFIELSNHLKYSNFYLVIGILAMFLGCIQIFINNKTKK
jgi:membrane associated rhomboid family serine protease